MLKSIVNREFCATSEELNLKKIENEVNLHFILHKKTSPKGCC